MQSGTKVNIVPRRNTIMTGPIAARVSLPATSSNFMLVSTECFVFVREPQYLPFRHLLIKNKTYLCLPSFLWLPKNVPNHDINIDKRMEPWRLRP